MPAAAGGENGGFMTTSVPSTTNQTFIFTVDYGQTLEQMIAAGRYDWTNDKITTERFRVEGADLVGFAAVLFHLDADNSSEAAKSQIEKAGYEVGKIEHVLSFGAQYPEEQRKFPIVGLGSVGEIRGERRVPCLDRGGFKRGLNLTWWASHWPIHCRFLGVRKMVSRASAS